MTLDMESIKAAALFAAKTLSEMGKSTMKEQILFANMADAKFDYGIISAPLYKVTIRFVHCPLDDNGDFVNVDSTNRVDEMYILAENMTVALEVANRDAEEYAESEKPACQVNFYIKSIREVSGGVTLSDKVAATVWTDEES